MPTASDRHFRRAVGTIFSTTYATENFPAANAVFGRVLIPPSPAEQYVDAPLDLNEPWQMRRDMLTPNYTTSWSQIPLVK